MDENIFDDAGIDLTPLIDVIFMLLVFFIMTTTFSRPVLDIVLPKSETAANMNEKPKELVIGIKQDGSIWHADKAISKADLPALLESIPEATLNLHVDEKAPFQSFVGIIDIAKEKRGGYFVISATRTDGD